jgi:hypothetical protein
MIVEMVRDGMRMYGKKEREECVCVKARGDSVPHYEAALQIDRHRHTYAADKERKRRRRPLKRSRRESQKDRDGAQQTTLLLFPQLTGNRALHASYAEHVGCLL